MAEGVAETNMEGAAPTAPSAPTGSGLDLIGLKFFKDGFEPTHGQSALAQVDPTKKRDVALR